ncbi:MAG: HlyD family efflux transporter periplasmic adaptor subunit [Oscillospiraceae bacterium]|nr:HlyD family efflux transporter periplasmic adaptor subunit [Oscillospiraceae bacterium]
MEELKETAVKPRRKKKKFKKRWLVLAVVVLAAAGGLLLRKKGANTQTVLASDTQVLSYTDLESSVSATGTVESSDTTKVYSTLAYQVKSVLVEVGDTVQEGDLLAELDAEPIENQIATQQTSMEVASGSAGAQVQSAYDAYENFKQGLDAGLNASLIGAQSQVDTAYDAYVRAQNAYDRYKENVELGENTQVLSVEAQRNSAATALDQAETALDTANEAYKAAKDAYGTLPELDEQLQEAKRRKQELEDAQERLSVEYVTLVVQIETLEKQKQTIESSFESAKQGRESARQAVEQAQSAYDIAQATYNAAVRGEDQALSDYADAVDSAWRAYQTALTSLDSTKKGTEDQLEAYSDTLASANAGANTAVTQESIRQLNQTLDDTKITAPVSGTVTAVYASVGSSGSGLLFVIEDTDHLVISTSVKGYDLGDVKTGMTVEIKSDATGDSVIPGTLTTIAPTAKKNQLGDTEASNDPSFEAEVSVDSAESGLRIGMEARLSYIIARQAHVLAVPYEAVFTDEAGQSCILVLRTQEKETYLVEKLPVTTGLDDDLDIAVSGTGVEEGLRVITDAKSYLSCIGKPVTLAQATGLEDMMAQMEAYQ